MASTLGTANPFRYRSYYYDNETGYYYLQSRYYDPIVGRFINADDVSKIDGTSLFGYCKCNPVNFIDSKGNDGAQITAAIIEAMRLIATYVCLTFYKNATKDYLKDQSALYEIADKYGLEFNINLHDNVAVAKICDFHHAGLDLVIKIIIGYNTSDRRFASIEYSSDGDIAWSFLGLKLSAGLKNGYSVSYTQDVGEYSLSGAYNLGWGFQSWALSMLYSPKGIGPYVELAFACSICHLTLAAAAVLIACACECAGIGLSVGTVEVLLKGIATGSLFGAGSSLMYAIA